MKVLAVLLAGLLATLVGCSTTTRGHGQQQSPCPRASAIKPPGGEYCYSLPAAMTLIPPATRLPTETEVALDDTDRITVSLFGFPNDVSSLSNDDTRAIFEAILRDRFGTAVKLGTARWTVSPAGRTLGYDGTATRAATGKSLRAQYRFVFVRNDVIQVTCGWGTAGKQEQIQAACRSVLATLQFPGQ